MVSQQLNNLIRLITIIIFLGLTGLAGSHRLGIVPSVQAAETAPQAIISSGWAKPQAITNSVKMVSDSLVRPGDGETVTYTIMVTTASPNPVGISVKDRLPPELELVSNSLTATEGVPVPVDDGQTIDWVPTISATTPATMSYQAILTGSVVGGQIIENVVEIREGVDFITKTATITVQQANLVMSKTVWSAHEVVQPTDQLTYTIIISNLGNDLATNVLVRDELPETLLMGKSLVTTTTIAGGESVTFTIPVTVRNIPTESWTISNTAFYSYTTGSGQQSVELQAGKPNLSISKQVMLSKEPVEIGDTVTYQIVVTNKGIAIAENLHVVDQLPSGIDTTDELEDRITLQANQSYTMPIVGFVTNRVSEGQTLINTAYYTHEVAYTYTSRIGNDSVDFMVGRPQIYLPLIIKEPPIPTATPTFSPTPTATPTTPLLPRFVNSGFEQRSLGWQEESKNDFDLIYESSDLPRLIFPKSGDYVAWLGGRGGEESDLSQQVSIPSGYPSLYFEYWYWIASDDSCDNDRGYVEAEVNNQRSRIYVHQMCGDTGWQRQAINVTSYQGQNVTFHFVVKLNSSLNTNFFIDDVGFQYSSTRIASDQDLATPYPNGSNTTLKDK